MALNHVVLMGRLAADPTLRSTASGKTVASFRLAVDRGIKGPDGNSIADWLDCVAWEKTADFVSKYFGKGQMICVEGQMQSRSYEDKNGNKRTAVEVAVRQAHFCGGKSENRAEGGRASQSAKPDVYAGDEYAEIDDEGDLPF